MRGESGIEAADAEDGRQSGRRVIMVNRYFHPDLSASSRMVGGLAFALAESGRRVDVVTSRHRHDDAHAALDRRDLVRGVRVHRVGGSRFGRGGLLGRAGDYATFHAAAMAKVLALARPGDIVVACTDPPLLSVSIAAAARLRQASLVNWLFDVFPETASALGIVRAGGAVDRLLRRLRDASLARAAMNVALGPRMAKVLLALGAAPERIRIIHNYADGDTLSPVPPESNPLRREWRLEGRFVVGYSGNMGRAHEFGTIVAAAEALRNYPDIVFLFVGDGHYRTWVEQQVKVRRLDNVHFQPLQPEDRLAYSLGVADLHLVSLRPELEGLVLPSKVYGIAASGRPTLFIGDGDGEVAGMLRQNQCGATVAIGDATALAERILSLSRDPDLVRQWGDNARHAFEQRYQLALAAAAWRTVLDGLDAEAQAASPSIPLHGNAS